MADDDTLTDEQMLALLKGAETRLLEKEQNSVSTGEPESFHFPRLSTGEITKSHVRPGQHGQTQLREHGSKRKASTLGMRKVEDPVFVRKRLAEVSIFVTCLHLPMRKSFPIFP